MVKITEISLERLALHETVLHISQHEVNTPSQPRLETSRGFKKTVQATVLNIRGKYRITSNHIKVTYYK